MMVADNPYVALAVLGVLFGGLVWELVWGLPGCVRDLIAPRED
jgi:hypothetical protein